MALLFGLATTALGAEPAAVPGQYLLKFRRTTSASTQSAMRFNLGVQVLRSSQLTGANLVQTNSGTAIDDSYAKQLLALGLVEYIEPNYLYSINATPNDSMFSDLWGMHNTGQTGGSADIDIDAPAAWDLTTGSSNVVVGVVDTGVNYNHPDLAANIWTNPNEIPGNGIDDDNNGYIDDIHGINAINHTGDPLDDHSHGSHCSGTIGGRGNNGTGVAGVNWNVKIMGLKFLNASGQGTTENAIVAIEYAVMMRNRGVNIRVLSNSWGGGGESQALGDAIEAANAAGILFVAAAGNSSQDNDSAPSYPANYGSANVVSVAAIDHNGNLASFSSYGATTVDLAAPGVGIVSTVLGSNYGNYNGTSMATPHVSGVAALVLAREPNLTVAQLKSRLLTTVKPLATLSGLMVSAGIVNALNALTNTQTPQPPAPPQINYTKSSIPVNYDTSLGTRISTADDAMTVVNLPFTFSYYQTEYNRIAVSNNGRVVPLATAEATPSSGDWSNRLNPGISAFNDDLYPSAGADGGVWAKVSNNLATITWVVMPYAHRAVPTANSELRFQVKLYADGQIELHYLDSSAGDANYDYGASATVGLAPASGGAGVKLTVTHNTANPTELGSNKALRFKLEGEAGHNDIDGDGTSDLIVWRPSSGIFYILTSQSNFSYAAHISYQLGLPGDIPLTGDFDGDKKTDLAVWRPSNGTWYFRSSTSNYSVITATQWGAPGDVPLVGDTDGDKISDIIVYRANSGMFYTLLSTAGFNRDGALSGNTTAMLQVSLGGYANDPLVGDFTGDGRADFVAIWQPYRWWTVKNLSNTVVSTAPWGNPGDTPLACDIGNYDKVMDKVIYRIESDNTARFYIWANDGSGKVVRHGSVGMLPKCDSDFDGDGKADVTAIDPAGKWHILKSSTGGTRRINFGLAGDIPL